MKTAAHVLFVLVVGTAHWIFAALLIFFGTGLAPTFQQTLLSNVGFTLLLPFSPLIFFFPDPMFARLDVYLGFLSGLCWAELYWQIGRRCIRRFRDRRVSPSPVA
jgi:hypothetical protein